MTADEFNAQQKALAEDLLSQLQASDDMEALFDQLMNEYSEDGRDSDGSLARPQRLCGRAKRHDPGVRGGLYGPEAR